MSANSSYLTGIPSTPNTVSDSWQPAVEQIDTTKKGFNAVSLGNWDTTTTKPTVLAGSEIEAAGGVVRVATDETILDDPGGVIAGTVYLVVDFSGVNPEWYFTNDAPVWNVSLAGFYEAASGSVNWKYTGHTLLWDGSTAYSDKSYLSSVSEPSNTYFRGLGFFGGTSILESITLTGTFQQEFFPAGYIHPVRWDNQKALSASINLGAVHSGTFATSGIGKVPLAKGLAGTSGTFVDAGADIIGAVGSFLSDGTNYTVNMSSPAAAGNVIIYYATYR